MYIRSVVLCFFIFLGCNSKEIVESESHYPVSTGTLFPMNMNNIWYYRAQERGYNSTTVTINNYDLKINYLISVNNNNYYNLTHANYRRYFPAYFSTDDGIFVSFTELNVDNPSLVFKYPTFAGETNIVDSKLTVVTHSVDTTVTVPAGQYNCIHYEYIYNSPSLVYSRHFFFYPGIGIIAQSGYMPEYVPDQGISVFKLELESYQLNQ